MSSRVTIPSSVRETVQNIKEIAGNHGEDEIYAMLKECQMDPNEAAQKLLNQDPFHEVKRRRDRRREVQNSSNKEVAEPRGRSAAQGRGSRGGRGNYTPRHISNDAGGGRNSAHGKDIATNHVAEKAATPCQPNLQESKMKEIIVSRSITVAVNDPPNAASVSAVRDSDSSGGSGGSLPEVKAPELVIGSENATLQPTTSSGDSTVSKTTASSSAVCFSPSDPVLLPSNESRLPGAVGTIKREVGVQRASVEPNANAKAGKRASGSESRDSSSQAKVPEKSAVIAKSQFSDSSRPTSSSTHGSFSSSRPSSSYNNQTQPMGPQRANSIKEWKPKPTNPAASQGSTPAVSSALPVVTVENGDQSQSTSSLLSSEETSKVQKKLDDLHLTQRHVILPNHIRVPESERSNFTFGSFGVGFELPARNSGVPESKRSSQESDTSQAMGESVEEQSLSNQNAQATVEEGGFVENVLSSQVPDSNEPVEGNVLSTPVPDINEPTEESGVLAGGTQYSMVESVPNYNLGFVPPMFGGQLAPVENSDSQARDASRVPNFAAPIDPTSYYAQFYRSVADGDGRISPFTATKYNGNVAAFPVQTSQSPQESANSLVISTAAPTPLVTQPAGLMQSSIPVTQQPVPVFRPPAGMPISHFPANYFPYGHYLPPFYVAPPGMHHFLGSSAFPPQPQAGGVYPAPPGAAAPGVKYPFQQFKSGNSTHMGVPNSYAPYGSSPGYSPSSATAGNSTSNEDLSATQFKDNNVYVTGQQNEGPTVWIPAPTRDMSSLPSGSYYNLAPQGNQHVTLTPTPATHGAFGSFYHPAQAVTAGTVQPLVQQSQPGVDMMGGGASSLYQQQSNWPNSF